MPAGSTAAGIDLRDFSASAWAQTSIKYAFAIDLTATFGAGNEPTKTEMDYLLSRYPNGHFNGTVNDLVSAQNHYLRDRIGAVSPEGVITAPVGTAYTDSMATNGAIKWIKASGSGNTGWTVSVGDTGWRNITSLLNAGYTGTAYVRRCGTLVSIMLDNVQGANGAILTLPSGFASAKGTSRRAMSYYYAANDRWLITLAGSTGNLSLDGSSGASVYLDYSFQTAAVWPATLPGTAA